MTELIDNTALVTTDEAQPVTRVVREPASATDMRVVEVSEALAPAYARASTLELTDAEVEKLMAPFPDSSVDIRPHDGLIFLSHIHISDRLNAVFKPGKWSLLCRKHWLEGGTLYGEYVLLIRGCFVGESVGGHQYQPNNPKTNYSDSLESTAAEALRRIAGKRLSCGSQVWHKDYAEKWVRENAEQANGKWRKKMAARPVAPATQTPARATTPANQTVREAAVALAKAPDVLPATPAERKVRLMATLRGFEPEANKVFVEEGLTFEGEMFTDISLTRIELMTPDQMLALIKTVKMRKAESDQIPDAAVPEPKYADRVTPDGHPDEMPGNLVDGTVEETNAKNGTTKGGKAFTKFGIKIDGVWHNTFNRTLFEAAMPLKGQRVRYTFAETKFGRDLLTIESAQENTP